MRLTRPVRLLVDGTDAGVIAEAAGAWGRLLGLMGRARPPSGLGLLIRPCSSVHTCFMRFTLDIVYLDGTRHVLKARTVRPWRVSAARGARAVLELPAGEAHRLGLVPGVLVEVAP